MINKRISEFEKLGLGLFVHYGVYSTLARGERARAATKETDEEYDKYLDNFKPAKNWASNIASFAKRNGFKYVVLTTRHHDGFSLYDTMELSDFDSTHISEKRDLVKEFVQACERYNLIPFFYHTMIDWRAEKRFDSFDLYLEYLRKSIDILCTNYGKIGGFWFDGQRKYPNANRHLDELYGIIRKKQPDAMIINNSGLNALGAKTHEEIDAVTYERSTIQKFDRIHADGKYSVEMCQTLNSHWGYAKNDICYKSVSELINDIAVCRCYGGNYLLNIGPLPNGTIRAADKSIINLLGERIKRNKERLFTAVPFENHLDENYFILKKDNTLYVVFLDVSMEIDSNVQRFRDRNQYAVINSEKKIKSSIWLDDNTPAIITIENGRKLLYAKAFTYGTNLFARVAKIEI